MLLPIWSAIAKSLGPQVIAKVLLTNRRMQEHYSRVCTTVASADDCGQDLWT